VAAQGPKCKTCNQGSGGKLSPTSPPINRDDPRGQEALAPSWAFLFSISLLLGEIFSPAIHSFLCNARPGQYMLFLINKSLYGGQLIHCLHTNFCLMKVSTRFLSASPPIYWAAAHILASPNCSKRWGYLICVYFIAYILLGSLLFSNFYPFT
jgi:hypothetical protein